MPQHIPSKRSGPGCFGKDGMQSSLRGRRTKGREGGELTKPGGRGEVECEREARSLGSLRDPNDRASRSHSTSPLPPLCTPATQVRCRVEIDSQ